MDEEKALKFLLKHADEAEIYYSKEVSNKLVIRKGRVEGYERSHAAGYGVRVICKKKMGFAFSNTLDERVLRRALETARISEEDEHLSLPDKQRYRNSSGFDGRLCSLEPEEAVELAKELIAPCDRYKVNPSKGALTWSTSEVRIANSWGITGEEKSTYCSCYLNTVAKDSEAATGLEYAASRFLDIDFASVGKSAARLARESLGATKIDSRMVNAVLRPNALAELIENVFAPSLSADNAQRGRSYLAGKVGEKLFAEDLEIVDDGTLEGGLNTAVFDSEGVATQRTPLVEKGVVKGFIYDTYSANKAGRKSTGNAGRDSYSSLPQVEVSNLVVSGPLGIEERELVVHGLIGAHTGNAVSGDFSVETRNAFYKGRPVKKIIIAGNVFELFRNLLGCGRDYKQVSSVLTPSIEFSDVKIVG
jgi:PmbA protein